MKRGQDETQTVANEVDSKFADAKVLVTGGAGFLGSWLCEVLEAAGASVDCVDNFSAGRPENTLRFKRRIKIIRGDVESVSIAGRYDYVFHLSSRASPEEYQRFPIETLRANSIGTMRMLDLARTSHSVLVYASTSEVYGDASVVPTPESYFGNVSPVGIRSCYDEGKRFGEAACMAYFRQHQVNVRIARIFNTYGPRIRSDGIYARVVPKFILQALSNHPITIHGTGAQTRSFCYVTDMVRGLLLLASVPKLDGMVFNVGNPKEIDINTLANEIIKSTRSKSKIQFESPREDDPQRRCPKISRMRELGWSPKVVLSHGLRNTIAYFRDSN